MRAERDAADEQRTVLVGEPVQLLEIALREPLARDEAGVGEIHGDARVLAHERAGAAMATGLEADDRNAGGEEEVERRVRGAAATTNQMAGFGDDGFHR